MDDRTPLPEALSVLLVDDHPAIRAMLKIALEPHGFRVLSAPTSQAAVDLYRQEPEAVDLVLLDVVMPGMDGPATFDELQKINPAVRVCFMSGNPGKYSLEELTSRGAAFIAKPFRLAALAELLWKLSAKP